MKNPERLGLSFPSNKKYLSVVGAFIQEACAHVLHQSASFAYNVQLAVDEAVVNVITHAYGDDPSGRVELSFEMLGDRLVIEIRDWGRSFEPRSLVEPDLLHPQERGYGVYLIRRLMDRVQYEVSATEGNRVILTKMLS